MGCEARLAWKCLFMPRWFSPIFDVRSEFINRSVRARLQVSVCSSYDLTHMQIYRQTHTDRQHFHQLIWTALQAELISILHMMWITDHSVTKLNKQNHVSTEDYCKCVHFVMLAWTFLLPGFWPGHDDLHTQTWPGYSQHGPAHQKLISGSRLSKVIPKQHRQTETQTHTDRQTRPNTLRRHIDGW